MKSPSIPPLALRFFEHLSPVVLAVFIPSVCLRAWGMDRARVFNTTLHEETIWDAAPSLISVDFLTAFLFGLALWPLIAMGRSKRAGWRVAGQGLQATLCVLAMLILAIQYRVYRELGFYPNMNTFRHFAGPGSPFLRAAESFMSWETLALIGLILFCPLIILICGIYFRSRTGIILLALTIMFPIAWFWPCPQAVAGLRVHPFERFPPNLFDRPSEDDPEISRDPPSMASLCGMGRRDDCSTMLPKLSQPSIVLVIMESTGDMYLHDGDNWKYPHLGEMAAGAVEFPRYYAPAGTSNPAVYSIMASRHAIPSDEWWETEEVRAGGALGGCMQSAGYATGMFMSGCCRFFFDGPLFRSMGWDIFLDGDDIAHLDNIPKKERDLNSGVIDDKNTVAQMLSFIEENQKKGKPSLSVFYTGIPHLNYQFKSRGTHAIHTAKELTGRQCYENQIAYVDGVLGEMNERLLKDGFFKNGYVVLTGDHGQGFGTHPDVFAHGTHVYDEVQHVPMLIYNPLLLRHTKCLTQGSHLDMAPTILDLAGLQEDGRMDGASLLSRTGPIMVFIGAAHNKVKLGAVDFPYKAIYHMDTGTTQLFRLDTDPTEQSDLSKKESALATAYRSWIKSYVYHYLTPAYMRNPPPAHRAFFEGRRALDSGQSGSAAMQHFQEALRLQPDFDEARRMLAECYYRMGVDRAIARQWEVSREQFEEALRLETSHSSARIALSDLNVNEGKTKEALELLKSGRETASNDTALTLRLAWLMATAEAPYEDAAQADRLIKSVIGEKTASVATMEVFALVAGANGRTDEAVELEKQAAERLGRERPWDEAAIERITKRLAAYQRRGLPASLPYPGSPLTNLPAKSDKH